MDQFKVPDNALELLNQQERKLSESYKEVAEKLKFFTDELGISKKITQSIACKTLENFRESPHPQGYLNLVKLMTEPFFFSEVPFYRLEDHMAMAETMLSESYVFGHDPEKMFRAFNVQKGLMQETYVMEIKSDLKEKGLSEIAVEQTLEKMTKEYCTAYRRLDTETRKLFKTI